MKALFIFLLQLTFLFSFFTTAYSASDPRLAPNNKVGINNLSANSNLEDISTLVNTNGDWGWVVVVIKKDQRNVDMWQSTFNQMNKNHLIPIVRLATVTDSDGNWQKPTQEDAQDWAQFLNDLRWPTKNRYVQVYNEVNRASEWGGTVDAANYAKELNKTIDALKAKSSDFFVLNAPLDLALATTDSSLDASVFFQTMSASVPNIFTKLDGWASHSYPNPDFSASPSTSGRTAIDGYKWELLQIGRDLPVFITETGWKRGANSEEQIASFYKSAFENVWSDSNVVAVTPFVFDYAEPMFSAFSFKKSGGFYKYYDSVRDLEKVHGEPLRENIATILTADGPKMLITKLTGEFKLKLKNDGNFLWKPSEGFVVDFSGDGIQVGTLLWSDEEIYPGEEVEISIPIKTLEKGVFPYSIKVLDGANVIAERSFTLRSETYLSLIIDGLQAVF